MNKVKAFLEKNSQWLAVAVGGLWLLYMIYAHVLASPNASVDVKGNALGPGSVDQFIEDNEIQKLKDAMANTGTLPPLKEDYPSIVKRKIALVGETPLELAANFMNSGQVQQGLPGLPKPPMLPPPNIRLVNALVVPPAPIKVDVVVGKSIITDPNAATVAGGQTQKRQLWATIFGTLPMADLNKAFAAAGVNNLGFPPAQQTLVLKVEVVRTEQLANSAFGNPTTIATQYADLNVATPAQPLVWPANKVSDELAFREQARSSEKIICQPAFFLVNKGDNWRKPGEALAPVGVVAPPPPPPPPPPNPKQRQSVTPHPTTPPRTPVRGPNGPNGLLPLPALQKQRIMLQQVFTDNGLPGNPFPGAPTGPGGIPAVPLPPANLPGEAPTDLFFPSNAADINLWVHDLTVQSGKTYQYQMRYTILNPVFLSPNVVPAANAAWAQQFSIDSPLSAATPSVAIPDTTSFFTSSYIPSKNEVKFDIFVWDVSGVLKTSVSAQPGDLLDPNLKLTLVDARKVGVDDTIVLLMDENGTILTRSIKSDSRNPVYDNLKREADAAKQLTP